MSHRSNRGRRATHIAFLAALLISGTVHAGWIMQNSGTHRNLHGITASHSFIDYAWACGDSGIILYTSDGGATWVEQVSGTTNHLFAIAFMEQELGPVIAVGDNGTILKTTDSGITWQQLPSPTLQALRDISDFGIYIVGDSGTILESPNYGISFDPMESPTSVRLNAVSDIFSIPLIAGDDGIILRMSPVTSWAISNSGTSADLYGIPLFNIANLVVGGEGLILRSSDFGQNWHPQNSPTTATLKAVEFSVNNTSHIYAVGDNGTIIKSTNEGVNWTVQQSGTTRNLNEAFFYLDDWNGWVVGDSGTILRTTDGGQPLQGTSEPLSLIPEIAVLHQNYPNPFNSKTTIRFDLAVSGYVSLAIYDMLGRKVVTLTDDMLPAGSHLMSLDAATLASGLYICELKTQAYSERRKLLLLK